MSAGELRGARGARRLPLAEPLPYSAEAGDVVHGLGRIADRAVTDALGWSNGDRLTLTAQAGVVDR